MIPSLIHSANVQREFQRNAGKAESILGKWLQEKLTNKKYDEITNRMKEFVSAMPDAEKAIALLEQNVEPYRELELTQESWKKNFPIIPLKLLLGNLISTKNFSEN